MEKEIVLDNKYAEVAYFPNEKLGQVTWKKFITISSEDYRKPFLTLLEYTSDKDFFYFISDSRNGGVARPEDRKWFQSHIVPEAAKQGLKNAAIIIPKDPFKKYYMNAILKFINRNAPYNVKIFYDTDSALKFLLGK